MNNDRNEDRDRREGEIEALRFISHTLNSMNEILVCTNELIFECIGVTDELRGGLVYKDHPHIGVFYDNIMEVMHSVWNHYSYTKYAISKSKLKVDIFKDRDLTVRAGTIMYKIHDTSNGMGPEDEDGDEDSNEGTEDTETKNEG